MPTPCVAITGMNALPANPGPGLAVARSLRASPAFEGKIVGLSYDALDPGLYLKQYCDSAYLLPYPSSGDESFIDRITEIKQRENIDVLIPCLDAELPAMVRLAPQMAEMGIRTFLPTGEQLAMRNKDRLSELASLAGIQCPEIKSITNTRFFYDAKDKDWTYPLVVKGVFYDARIVEGPEEGAAAFQKIAAEWGYPVLVQKRVKGEEYNLTAVGDGEGKMYQAVMMKKMAVTDKGKAWAGVSVFDQGLMDASVNLIQALKWRGPLEVEVMRDKNGVYHLIEINPRFPAWIYLSVGVGQNLPWTLLQLILGETPEEGPEGQAGILYIRYAEDITCPITSFEHLVVDGGSS